MSKVQLSLAVLAGLTVVIALFLTSCVSSKKGAIPTTSKTAFEDTYTIIWNGYSKAFIYKNSTWERAETFDYYFDVIQKRYNKTWKSVKSLHRVHPGYNGKAGQRDQTMYFELDYKTIRNGVVSGTIQSSLGTGTLETDNEYRNSEINIDVKDASAFMPYNKIRITQQYNYEKGKLTETVLLFKLVKGREQPFMKNEEEAYFYVKGSLTTAPTRFE